jgi:hypothetical protein
LGTVHFRGLKSPLPRTEVRGYTQLPLHPKPSEMTLGHVRALARTFHRRICGCF